MNNQFIQGHKARFRYLLNRVYLAEYTGNDALCECVQPITNKQFNSGSDILQTENQRVSRILTGTLGGRTTFGNNYKPVVVNYLGDWEGRPGGSSFPLRNRF